MIKPQLRTAALIRLIPAALLAVLAALGVACAHTGAAREQQAVPRSLAIVVFGGSGRIGQRIIDEALARGHRVTAVSRRPQPASAPARDRLSYAIGDILDAASVARLAQGQDVVVDATASGGGLTPGGQGEDFHLRAAQSLVSAMRSIGRKAPRLLVVGGAATLEVEPGKLLIDTMPGARGEPVGQKLAFDYYRTVADVSWTFLSPSQKIVPGTRTGKFRLGGDQLLRDAAGNSSISMEDFAVAMLDEIEHPAHVRRRFTVGY
ncbi:MAG: NAD(P)H-binding protein [Gammaproteobacteria bacterium]|nr:NAD(P)H-binding protein [Gammaproteobacteria bacterium]